MNLHTIIREKRKALSLTQEQVAAKLGVSVSAVYKWETGRACPDITLLPALARLLHTDVNTLLSFREDLSPQEVADFLGELDRQIRHQGYAAGFQLALDKLRQYPASEDLLYSITLFLEGALTLYCVPEPQEWREKLAAFYRRLADSADQKIREGAVEMLVAYARIRGEYAQAEALLQTLPTTTVDKEEQLAILWQCQGKTREAEKLWKRRALSQVAQLQRTLSHLLDQALEAGEEEAARCYAGRYEGLTALFAFPRWMQYNARLLMTLSRKDGDRCAALLGEMLPAMEEAWQPGEDPLYHVGRETLGEATALSARLAAAFCGEIETEEAYAFLRDREDVQQLLARFRTKGS